MMFHLDQNIVYVVGSNSHGQLGIGEKEKKISTAIVLNSHKEHKVYDVVCGHTHSAAVTTRGKVLTFCKGLLDRVLYLFFQQ